MAHHLLAGLSMRVVAASLVTLMLPQWALACAVCSDGEKQNAMAFFWTTVFLTLLPLGLLAALVRWVQKKSRPQADLDARELSRLKRPG